MRADTWSHVASAFADAGSALVSRLRLFLPGEQARRDALDAEFAQVIREALASAKDAHPWCDDRDDDDDAEYVASWMAENGFAQRSDAWGVDEQTEAAITVATDAFRVRLAEILGHDDFDFEFSLGLDNADEDA